MTDEMKQIAYNEGAKAFEDDVKLTDCPYEGVSDVLAMMWREGWWETGFWDMLDNEDEANEYVLSTSRR
jgi:hypothetical protein